MAKRSKRRKAGAQEGSTPTVDRSSKAAFAFFGAPIWSVGMPLLLAAVTFLVYGPSLQSDFVYDGRLEILREGFITSISNLPAVLTLKVMGMKLMLGQRPGQLLYLMLIAAAAGKDPWMYHLGSNLLHAANVALLFVILGRLVANEFAGFSKGDALKLQIARVIVTVIFAVHPIAVETVSAINYSSDLLVTFFTMLALLAATAFRADNIRSALLMGCAGACCCFAAVTCKESGAAVAPLLMIYWFLFRRHEAKGPWLLFLGAAAAVTAAFLAARFQFAPPSPTPLPYLGGSFFHVVLIQPKLWVFMMGQLIWPTNLSADYTLENVDGLPTPVAWAILLAVVLLQSWLAIRSRMGALGMAIYWLGLATVSNFIPLYRLLGDRFYYLPLAGLALQLLALLALISKSRFGFWVATTPLVVAIAPLLLLTTAREKVFANDFSLWRETIRASPFSWTAHDEFGDALAARGELDEAMAQYQQALAITTKVPEIHCNMGNNLLARGRVDEAIAEYQQALAIDPHFNEALYNLGNALEQKGEHDEAIAEYEQTLASNPRLAMTHNNLGIALFHVGRVDEAIAHYQKASEIDPGLADAPYNLGNALLQKGAVDEAIAQYERTLAINPRIAPALCNLGTAYLQKGDVDEAIAEYRKALEVDPNFADAQTNLADALAQKREAQDPSGEVAKKMPEAMRNGPK